MVSACEVCPCTKGDTIVTDKSRKRIKLTRLSRMPVLADASALLRFFSPRERERIALNPTPVPDPKAIIRFCSGKATVRAATP